MRGASKGCCQRLEPVPSLSDLHELGTHEDMRGAVAALRPADGAGEEVLHAEFLRDLRGVSFEPAYCTELRGR